METRQARRRLKSKPDIHEILVDIGLRLIHAEGLFHIGHTEDRRGGERAQEILLYPLPVRGFWDGSHRCLRRRRALQSCEVLTQSGLTPPARVRRWRSTISMCWPYRRRYGPGPRKTHIAIALGVQAIEHQKSAPGSSPPSNWSTLWNRKKPKDGEGRSPAA